MDKSVEWHVIANAISGVWPQIAPVFRAEHFQDADCRMLAEAIKRVDSEQDEVTPVTVGKAAGYDISEMIAIAKNASMRKQTLKNVEFLAENYRKRVIETTVKELHEVIKGSPLTAKELLVRAQQTMIEALEDAGGLETKSMGDVTENYFEYRLKVENGELPETIPFSMPNLTYKTGGLEQGNLVVLAARPSMGKTALALNEIYSWTKKGYRGMFVSLEQQEIPIARRLVARIGRIDSHKLRGKLGTDEKAQEGAALSEMRELPLSLVDKRGLDVDQILSLARLEKHKHPGLQFVAVDHLTEIGIHGDNTHKEITKIVKKLRDLAGELGIWVLLLCQLNRGVEGRDNKRPAMSDLRESGSIEEHADVVLMLYRHGYYHPGFGSVPEMDRITELAVKKNREGEMGGALITMFDMPHMRFYEATHEHKSIYQEAIRGARRKDTKS